MLAIKTAYSTYSPGSVAVSISSVSAGNPMGLVGNYTFSFIVPSSIVSAITPAAIANALNTAANTLSQPLDQNYTINNIGSVSAVAITTTTVSTTTTTVSTTTSTTTMTTTTTVATSTVTVSPKLRFTGLNWTADYENKSSNAYIDLATQIRLLVITKLVFSHLIFY